MSTVLAQFWLRPVDGINLLILAVLLWILFRVINDEGNLIVWADFISSRGPDGRQHGDIDKVGKVFGIVLATVTVMMYADNEKVEPTGLAALLGVSLTYLCAVSAYSSYLRSKQSPASPSTTIDTTTHTQEVK